MNNFPRSLNSYTNNIPGVFCCFQYIKTTDNIKLLSLIPEMNEILEYPKAEFQAICNDDILSIIDNSDKTSIDILKYQITEYTPTIDYTFKVYTRSRHIKYIRLQAEYSDSDEDNILYTCYLSDVTHENELLKSIKQHRSDLETAMSHANMDYWEYYPSEQRLILCERRQNNRGLPECIYNMPDSLLELEPFHPEDIDSFRMFFKNMNVISQGEGSFRLLYEDGYHWEKFIYSSILDNEGHLVKILGTIEALDSYKELEHRFVVAASQIGTTIWNYDIIESSVKGFGDNIGLYSEGNYIKNVPESTIKNGYIHPDDANAARKLHASLRDGATSASSEIRFYNKLTNEYNWKRIVYTTIFDKAGIPINAIGTAIDISGQKLAEKMYQKELQRRKTLESDILSYIMVNISKNTILEHYDNSPLFDFELPLNGNYIDTINLFVSIITKKEDKEKFLQTSSTNNLIQTFENNVTEITLDSIKTYHNNRLLWINLVYKLLLEPETGDILCIIYVYDINETIIINKLINAIVELDYDSIMCLELNNKTLYEFSKNRNNNRLITHDNIDIKSYITEQIISKILPNEDYNSTANISVDNILSTLHKSDSFNYVGTIIEDNQIHSKLYQYSYIDKENSIILLTISDVTKVIGKEHAKNINLTKALNVARYANQAKSTFLSRISHEIRTPLNAIIGYLSLSEYENTVPSLKECINGAHLSSKQLLDILNDVLDMSSIESGKFNISYTSFDIKEVIMSVCSTFYAQAYNKNIHFDIILNKIINEILIGDKLRLMQILTNLLSNAIKFTPELGFVNLVITQEKGDNNNTTIFKFEVNDTGIGMTPEFVNNVFNAFEQENAEISAKYGGTGLGMSITKSLTNLMGGDISVKSIKGNGSTFTANIPFDISDNHDNEINLSFNNIRALIISDNKPNCKYISEVLASCSINSDFVFTGKKAIEYASKSVKDNNPYSLYILNWIMTDISGCDISKEIRSITGNEANIIACSYFLPNSEDTAKEWGITRFIRKPLFKSSLFDLLISLYGNSDDYKNSVITHISFNGERILVVDDHKVNILIIQKFLQKVNLSSEAAYNGKDAVDLFLLSEPGSYSAILMDVQMPDMDGLVATRLIRGSNHPDAESIPIIATTAHAFSEDIAKTLSAGMNAHISKPIDSSELFSTLDKFITHK